MAQAPHNLSQWTVTNRPRRVANTRYAAKLIFGFPTAGEPFMIPHPTMTISDMAPSAADSSMDSRPALVIGERDIVFNCPNCHGELVVDRDGAGLAVPCSHCGHALTIPDYQQPPPVPGALQTPEPSEPAVAAPVRHFDFSDKGREQLERRFNELKSQLKENRSQDTEMRGHVNRATMDLHRLQLKLKKLQERQADIDAEITALADWLDNNAA